MGPGPIGVQAVSVETDCEALSLVPLLPSQPLGTKEHGGSVFSLPKLPGPSASTAMRTCFTPLRDPGAEGPQCSPLAPPLPCCPCACPLGLPAPDLSNLSGQEGSSPPDWEAGLGEASPARSSTGQRWSVPAGIWECQVPGAATLAGSVLRPHSATPFPTCCPSCRMRPRNPVGGS